MLVNAEGVLIVTVELGVAVTCEGRRTGHGADEAADWLSETFDRCEIAATWAVDEPAHDAITRRLLARGPGHELALLGDPTWAGPGVSRGSFAREFSRRVLSARAAGMRLSTCVVRGKVPHEQLDILVKHSITALCDLDDSAGKRRNRPAEMRRRCFGLWELPVSTILPWFTAFPFRRGANLLLDHALCRSAAGGTILHVLIDAPRLAAAGTGARIQLERFLHTACTLRGEGKLRVETLAQAVLRKARPCPVMPSQSILRRAA